MTKQEMIENLNEDLAGELGAIIQYLIYAAKTTGPYRPQLSQFFLGEVNEAGRERNMTKQEMIENLNEDWRTTTGPYRPQLSQFFLGEVTDEQLHAQYLANKIVALGGEPTMVPRPVPAAATNKEMVEQVLAAEQKATRDYTERAQQAEELGDKGLVVQLEDMVRDETTHSEETERLLRDWPL